MGKRREIWPFCDCRHSKNRKDRFALFRLDTLLIEKKNILEMERLLTSVSPLHHEIDVLNSTTIHLHD